jgi:hypothetical protein
MPRFFISDGFQSAPPRAGVTTTSPDSRSHAGAPPVSPPPPNSRRRSSPAAACNRPRTRRGFGRHRFVLFAHRLPIDLVVALALGARQGRRLAAGCAGSGRRLRIVDEGGCTAQPASASVPAAMPVRRSVRKV